MGHFARMDGAPPAETIAVTGSRGDHTVWIVSREPCPGGYYIYRWKTNDTWVRLPVGGIRVGSTEHGFYRIDDQGLIRSNVNDNPLPGFATDIDAAGGGSQLWCIGNIPKPEGFTIHQWDDGLADWVPRPGEGVRIAVGQLRDVPGRPGRHVGPIVRNRSGSIFEWNPARQDFDPMPGRAHDVGLGRNGIAWCIGYNAQGSGNYAVHRWEPSSNNWSDPNQSDIRGAGVQIDVDDDGRAFVVNAEGQVWLWSD